MAANVSFFMAIKVSLAISLEQEYALSLISPCGLLKRVFLSLRL